MPLDSGASAMMHLPFLSGYNGQADMASGIGQGYGFTSGQAMGEGVVGGLANRTQAVGAPLLQGAMGMLGMDPVSMGFRAASKAWGGGASLLGAGTAGIAGMAGMGVAAAGVGYMGSQVYTGMAQQQALQQTLRANYGFMRPGGQGFDTGQMGQIGATLREMTTQFGPSGEVAGFKELTQLAGKMSQMGMAQGVRDVQEFSKRFKGMVDSLKTMAKELNTTLEGAMEFASAARGVGVFGTQNAAAFARQVKTTAGVNNLAVSEVTAMGSIGAQIARSVGGLGAAGREAGVKSIAQLGMAQKMGFVTEEDIYNATGLTGAEGKQAYATSQLERSSQFLKTGKGRWFLASMASKDGTLDSNSVLEYLSGGGTDVDRTRQMAQTNLAGVGRANFIRNEGRLRGEVLSKFGMHAQTIAMAGWLRGKGFDPTSDDDKSVLAFRRFTGMGEEDARTQLEQIRNLPEVLKQQQLEGQRLEYTEGVSQQRGLRGVEGVRKRLEQAREGIQSTLQSAGQKLMSNATETIERWLNKITDSYVTLSSEGSRKAVDDLMQYGHSQTWDRMASIMSSGAMRQMSRSSGFLNKVGGTLDTTSQSGNFLDRMGLTLETPGAKRVQEYTGQFYTDAERRAAYGGKMLGADPSDYWKSIGKGAAIGAGTGAVLGGVFGLGVGALGGAAIGGLIGGGVAALHGAFGGTTGAQELGAWAESDSAMNLVSRIASSDSDVRARALQSATDRMEQIQAQQKKEGRLGNVDAAEMQGLKMSIAGGELDSLRIKYGSLANIPPEEMHAFEAKHGSMDVVKNRWEAVQGAVYHATSEKIASIAREEKEVGAKELRSMLSSGMVTKEDRVDLRSKLVGQTTKPFDATNLGSGSRQFLQAADRAGAILGDAASFGTVTSYRLSDRAREQARKTGVRGAEGILERLMDAAAAGAELSGTQGAAISGDTIEKLRERAGGFEGARQAFAGLSSADQFKMARGVMDPGARQMLLSQAEAGTRMDSLIRRRGRAAATLSILGGETGSAAAKDIMKNWGKEDPDTRAVSLAKYLGMDTADEASMRALKDVAATKTGSQLNLAMGALKGTDAWKAHEKEVIDRKAESKREEDPLQSKIEQNGVKMIELMKLQLKKTPATAEEIAAATAATRVVEGPAPGFIGPPAPK